MRKLLAALLAVLLTSPVYAQTSNFYVNSSNGDVGIGTTSPIVSLDMSHQTDALALPIGTSGTRPTGANLTNGEIRYNSTTPAVEAYVNGAWTSLGIGAGTVNSGTQYQLGYYATTGTAISGTSSITTDASGDLTVSGTITPSQTGGIVGTNTNNKAQAGSVGEYIFANCVANGTPGASVTLSNGTPTVITYTGYPPSGAGTWTCPVYFTGASLPSGVSSNTTYWMVPLSANTFEISDTAAHALAGTNMINTSASGSGTCFTSTYNLTTVTTANLGAITLTAGDWDVSGSASFGQISATTFQFTSFTNSVSATFPNSPNFGGYAQLQGVNYTTSVLNVLPVATKRELLSATTNEYIEGYSQFSSGSMVGFGFVGARRAR